MRRDGCSHPDLRARRSGIELPAWVAGLLVSVLLLASCGRSGGSVIGLPSCPLEAPEHGFDATVGVPFDDVPPLTGGCGGSYLSEVLSGDLPPGLRFEDHWTSPGRRITGTPTTPGRYAVELRITDTGCTPFDAARSRLTFEVLTSEERVLRVLTAPRSSQAVQPQPLNISFTWLD